MLISSNIVVSIFISSHPAASSNKGRTGMYVLYGYSIQEIQIAVDVFGENPVTIFQFNQTKHYFTKMPHSYA